MSRHLFSVALGLLAVPTLALADPFLPPPAPSCPCPALPAYPGLPGPTPGTPASPTPAATPPAAEAASPSPTPATPGSLAPGAGEAPGSGITTPSPDLFGATPPAGGQATAERGEAGTGGRESFFPNMLGDLLLASRSVSFRYSRSTALTNVADNGSTSIVNSTISDDNSPLPRDRVSFRYNHFDSAQSVTGFGAAVATPGSPFSSSFAQTKNYNLDRYTFSFEKTFLEQLLSLEVRVPFRTSLSSDLNLSAGDVTGNLTDSSGRPIVSVGQQVFGVNSTPQNTLGQQGTQFEDITFIFKTLLYQTRSFALSGGLAVTVPTAPSTNVAVTDFSGPSSIAAATVERVRDFHIDNETWALSPFLAALYTPNERFFVQGFCEVDFPLNPSTLNYTETTPRGTIPLLPLQGLGPALQAPFSVPGGISEQALLHLDLGAGYWALRDPDRTWITGIAPSLELHYTTTLNNASIVTLPQDGLVQINPANPNTFIPEAPSQIGNQRNRVDILDMTVATTFLVAERATLAIGAAFPLKNGDDRTFDWELHFQLNYYFGGPRGRN